MASLQNPRFRDLVCQAVRIVGSQSALAEKMSRSQQQVSALCTRATFISAEDALAIDRATAGEVSKSDLRPDLWPAAPAQPQAVA